MVATAATPPMRPACCAAAVRPCIFEVTTCPLLEKKQVFVQLQLLNKDLLLLQQRTGCDLKDASLTSQPDLCSSDVNSNSTNNKD